MKRKMLFREVSDRCASVPKQTASAAAARSPDLSLNTILSPGRTFVDSKRWNSPAIHLNRYRSCRMLPDQLQYTPDSMPARRTCSKISLPAGSPPTALTMQLRAPKSRCIVCKIGRSPSKPLPAGKNVPQNFTYSDNDWLFHFAASIIILFSSGKSLPSSN